MSGVGVAMERAESPLVPHRPGPGVATSYGISVAQRLLSPMVVDGVVVQDMNGQPPSRTTSSGNGDVWSGGRIGTPALPNWGYPLAGTGSSSGLLGAPPMLSRRAGSNGSLGSAGGLNGWAAGMARPGSFRAHMAEIQAAGQAEMLTINEDGQFNADEFRRFDSEQLTPRSRAERGAEAANADGNAFGGSLHHFQTPRRLGSLRSLSSVTEGAGAADTKVDGGLVGGPLYYNGMGAANAQQMLNSSGGLSSSGRVPTPMVRERTPSFRERTPIVGAVDPNMLSSSLGRGMFVPVPSERRRQELLESLARRSGSGLSQSAGRATELLPVWLKEEAQKTAAAASQQQTSEAEPNRPLPLWLRKDEGGHTSSGGAEAPEVHEAAQQTAPDTQPPVWLSGGGSGSVPPSQRGWGTGDGPALEGMQGQLSSSLGAAGLWAGGGIERVPTAGLGRDRSARPGTNRGEGDTVLC